MAIPRVDRRDACCFKRACIAGRDHKPLGTRNRSDITIWRRESYPSRSRFGGKMRIAASCVSFERSAAVADKHKRILRKAFLPPSRVSNNAEYRPVLK